jgi:glycosyltransferase involved in cell wall biosynthesis
MRTSDSARVRVLELRSVRGTGGGPEKTIMLGAARADRAKFEVIVCYIRDRRDEVYALDERARALDIEYVEIFEDHSFDVSVWRQLRQIVRDRQIDIVHAHEYKTDLLGYLLSKRQGVIPLATAHAWTGNSRREKWAYYPVDKRVLARYPRVIAVSTDIKRELLRHGAHDDRVVVILNSIDPVAFRRGSADRSAVRSQLGLRDEDFVIGAVGRLERQKRFDVLLEAAAALVPAHPALRLVIAGGGSLLDELRETAARLGLADRCRFPGHRSDIAELHHAFDLYVQSSEYEGTPNSVLEAMAMETPLVATDVGGTSELASNEVHGLIVPSNNVAALKAGIDRAIRDSTGSRTRAEAARRRVEDELSFESRTRRLEAVYEDLVQRRTSHA